MQEWVQLSAVVLNLGSVAIGVVGVVLGLAWVRAADGRAEAQRRWAEFACWKHEASAGRALAGMLMSKSEAEPLVVDLRGAFLRRTDLGRANLSRSDLSGADFSFAILRGANLKEANLRGTILRGADLSEAKNLTRAQLEEAVIDHETKLPSYLREERR